MREDAEKQCEREFGRRPVPLVVRLDPEPLVRSSADGWKPADLVQSVARAAVGPLLLFRGVLPEGDARPCSVGRGSARVFAPGAGACPRTRSIGATREENTHSLLSDKTVMPH